MCSLFSHLILGHIIYTRILQKLPFLGTLSTRIKNEQHINRFKQDTLCLLIGENLSHEKIYIPEKGLYQNFLITGTIGSGKTSSAMYPFTKQLMKFNYTHPSKKIGMLILDVKGNFYEQVQQYAKQFGLEKDLIVIELKSNTCYNPLHKQNSSTFF